MPREPQTHTGAEVGKPEAHAERGEVWVDDGVVVDVVVVADTDRRLVRPGGLKRVDGFLATATATATAKRRTQATTTTCTLSAGASTGATAANRSPPSPPRAGASAAIVTCASGACRVAAPDTCAVGVHLDVPVEHLGHGLHLEVVAVAVVGPATSRSTTHEWRSIRFRLLTCTYDAPPWGVRAGELTKSLDKKITHNRFLFLRIARAVSARCRRRTLR